MGRRGVLILGILGFALGSIWLCRLVSLQKDTEPVPIVLADGTARAAFLEAQGVPEPVCIATETVRLPGTAEGAYQEYAAMQDSQGLPLMTHLGESATRYTFTSQEDDGVDTWRTELLVSDTDQLIGAIRYDPATRETRTLCAVSDAP